MIAAFVLFLRSITGVALKPYETYRRITERSDTTETAYIGLVCLGYFALASLVRAPAFRPFILTRQFTVLSLSAALGFFLLTWVFWQAGTRLGGRGSFRSVAVGWGYTLVPTVLWFLVTSLLYIILPPPRTAAVSGILFSIFYLTFSAAMLGWKLLLGYLTLRFSLRIDLVRILGAGSIGALAIAVYSFVMYRLGIFRIPFI
ncbi:hypothetical protein A2Z33_07600 [Candidatus Gottesmanbacteria bacterium RBG_16_52_11]|uniref:Yip1 domain-containing protein n=1 Tax=Candidatus Gottesmanbacteria bacterium RBG_16_52_11 TaxID=1798374 RepID=A0A1F5YNK9_9BACT|nr:MAG: hypothetical protein A2Z33_07600 [Candidatus Gottesmanbacteria bacterium RBG_16_52_11]